MRAMLATVALLSGCQTTPKLPEQPKIVQVEVVKYVPVPEELTRPCQIGEAQAQTYAEAKRLALVRREYLIECNKDKARIRALGEAKP